MNIAKAIVDKFGGTRKMAREIGVPFTTVQSWKGSGFIPARRQAEIMEHARRLKIKLRPADFFPRVEDAA